MSNVFVIQWNDPRIDFGPARQFGELREVVPRGMSVFRTDALIHQIDQGLAEFDPSRDFVVPVGNPTIIGMVFAILGQQFDTIKVLHWAARERHYVPLEFSINQL